MKHLLSTVAALALLTSTASAYEVTCGAPRVLVGDNSPDTNPVVKVEVSYVPEDHQWRIFHTLRSGLVVSRSEQYAITDGSTDNMAQWQGSHQKMRNLYMIGEVRRERDGIYYYEWQYNRNTNQQTMQAKAACRAVAPIVAQSQPSRPSSQPDIIIERRPEPMPYQQRRMAVTVMRFVIPRDVHNGHVKVRGGPGSNHALLGSIPAGAYVTATECMERDDGIAGAEYCLTTWDNLTGWVSRGSMMPQ